jgi:hypothetical protein
MIQAIYAEVWPSAETDVEVTLPESDRPLWPYYDITDDMVAAALEVVSSARDWPEAGDRIRRAYPEMNTSTRVHLLLALRPSLTAAWRQQ